MKRILTILCLCFAPMLFSQTKAGKDISFFIPKGYVLFEQLSGDLNKDGLEDKVLIIKGTDKSKVIKDEYRGSLDRNRRGIIILFNKKDHYELAVKNYNCFSSENEDGGVYYAPELMVDIKKGNLYVHYAHGRYGYWAYTFRFKDSDFELIGYDESNGGAVISSTTSINFLTKKKQEKVNTDPDAESGEEVFKETWSNIMITKRIKLSAIKDFDQLELPYQP
ncbi:MAG: hypothetical protein BGO31_03165 [Bacteroidetes bacterium 43-16]|nr:MAG: hypothetical protein BGO31_03165 [Bacteroidetes bacterium 43-16]